MTGIWPWLPLEQTTHVKLIGLAARSKSCGPTNQTIILNLYLEEWSLLPSKLIYLFHQIQIIPIAIFDNHDRVLRQHFQGGARQIFKNLSLCTYILNKIAFLDTFRPMRQKKYSDWFQRLCIKTGMILVSFLYINVSLITHQMSCPTGLERETTGLSCTPLGSTGTPSPWLAHPKPEKKKRYPCQKPLPGRPKVLGGNALK